MFVSRFFHKNQTIPNILFHMATSPGQMSYHQLIPGLLWQPLIWFPHIQFSPSNLFSTMKPEWSLQKDKFNHVIDPPPKSLQLRYFSAFPTIFK